MATPTFNTLENSLAEQRKREQIQFDASNLGPAPTHAGTMTGPAALGGYGMSDQEALNAISGVGTFVCILGLVIQSFWMTIFGMAVLLLSKSWFLDRMVWIYKEMKDINEEYGKWLY